MHTCIHACMHTYVRTYIHTRIHMCLFPSPNFPGMIGRLERWNVLTFVFLPLWVHVSLVCLQILVCIPGKFVAASCAASPLAFVPHSPSKFCQALRLAFHAPLISIGLSRMSGTFLFQENLYLTIQAAKGLSALFLSRCPMSHCSATEGSSRLSFGRWQRSCIWQGAVSQLSIQVPDTCLGTCSGFFMETGFSGLD